MQRLIFVTIDPSLGRLEYDSLSDQARMEIFISPISENLQKKLQDTNGNFLDVCDWYVVECDAEGNIDIIQLHISEEDTKSPIFSYIPPSVRIFNYKGAKECSFTLADLPPNLCEFSVENTQLLSEIDLNGFSSHLQNITIKYCGMQATCDARNLPDSLIKLNLNENKLHGSLSLDSLPRPMTHFMASDNNFSGKLLIDNLPARMYHLYLSRNEFTEFVLLSTPECTKSQGFAHRSHGTKLYIWAISNKIRGTAVVEKAINGNHVNLGLEGNMIEAVIDENGKKHRFSKRILKNQSSWK